MRLTWFQFRSVTYTSNDVALTLSIGLPNSPRLSLAKDQCSCKISGWHLTPGRARLGMLLSWLATFAGLSFVGWYYWGFKHNLPDWLRLAVNWTGAQFGYHLNFAERKWIYTGLWAIAWLAFRAWDWLLYRVFRVLLRKRTVIRFNADSIRLGWFGRRYHRMPAAPITFSAQPHPKLPWLQLKARLWNSNALAVFYQQIRVLVMTYGYTAVPLVYFTEPEDAERFSAVCRVANAYPLKTRPQPRVSRNSSTEVQNDPDL